MTASNIDNLRPPLRGVYQTQLSLHDSNWTTTLKQHDAELHKLLEKVDLFDIWSNKLQDDKVAKSLIPEIFMDAFTSINLACMGLYKYANACLRSELETALKLVYFSNHPVEFGWWCEGEEWYRGKNIWGEDYKYFENLNTVKKFDEKKPDDKKLFGKNSGIRKTYKQLSRYVHSGMSTFQTYPGFSPCYNADSFKKWRDNYNEVQQWINVIIALGFAEKFRGMKRVEQIKILKVGLRDKDYKKRLKDIFGLKIRGRI